MDFQRVCNTNSLEIIVLFCIVKILSKEGFAQVKTCDKEKADV